jgi:polysaccharide export outer membrane protein
MSYASSRIRTSNLFALLCLISFTAPAQIRTNLMAEAGTANLPSQRLGVDDLIAISVYDSPELTRTLRIETDGSIHLPLLKNGIPASGILPVQLESDIADALKSEQILVDPVVKVTVVEYHSRPIAVMGAVKKPVTFQSVGTVTLLDALARAEGLTETAGTEILVTRADQVERIPVKRLMKDADPSVNFLLHGGEEIRVPEAGKIFVVGNVKRPGAFPVRDTADESVLKMIALSEGLSPYASKMAYIYRRDDSGSKKEIPIELDKIMQRKSPDVTLQIDDLLYIPDNKTRRATMTALDRITMFGASTASGLLIWH